MQIIHFGKDISVDDKYEEAIKISYLCRRWIIWNQKALNMARTNWVETKAPDGFKLGGPVTFIVDKDILIQKQRHYKGLLTFLEAASYHLLVGRGSLPS